MTTRNVVTNCLLVIATVCCMGIIACGGKKGHCDACRNNSECASGECATFISNDGDKFLLCGNGSSIGGDNCSIQR